MSDTNQVNIVLHDNLYLRIDTTNYAYLDSVKEYFTEYVEGYRFNPLYKLHRWNGQKSLFNASSRQLPYGLLVDLIRHTKKEFPDIQLILDDEVKALHKGCDVPDITFNLSRYPRVYQEDCIRTALQKMKGCIVSCTASGKSLIIAYIIKELMKLDVKHSIIIVPTISLIEQFKADLLDYGIYPELIGIVNSKHKEFDKPIVIATWQSLKSPESREIIKDIMECVVVDEVHSCKAQVLSEIMQCMTNTKWRFGFTGTLPKDRLDELAVRSFIGPVLRTYTAKDLADEDFISKCTINMLYIDYVGKYPGDYSAVRSKISSNPYRMGLVREICTKTNHTILILVDKIAEGESLEELLRDSFPDRQVVFISGRDNSEVREQWRQIADTDSNVIVIATYQVIAVGTNIPSLRSMIFYSPSKSYIRVIQSIGRTLRKHECKEVSGSIVYDIIDQVKYLDKHGEVRRRHYDFENHTVIELDLKESNNNYLMSERNER